ncbi:aminotransferase class-III protein [Ceratobasidium sp. AG-Ba]|nr:aminotransferase class-III protein [Ceratobasidium sp. AG-Ba]
MAHLYKHLRVHQVFGANTDVGKTVLTTALVRAAATTSRRVFYLKPLSTGHAADADDRYSDPVSPHLAAARDQSQVAPTDQEFIRRVSEHIRKCASENATGSMFVETAGGVHSPALSGTLQSDAYRPLRLPTILIADSRLGGISSTISAYESLHLRGYDIDLVLCMLDPTSSKAYLNHEYLAPWFAEKGIALCSPSPPPIRAPSQAQDQANMDSYYSAISDGEGEMRRAEQILAELHKRRLKELSSMPHRAERTFWWPFVQHDFIKSPEKDVTTIDSAHNDSFVVHAPTKEPQSLLRPHIDGSASWWTQAFGHANSKLTLAAANAAGRYGHVLFPLAVHKPALELAENLIRGPGAGWAERVFYSDDGSTAVEVALKMAVRAVALRRRQVNPSEAGLNRNARPELGILGIKGSYHGDTIGAMDACEGGVYNAAVEWHRERGFWFDPPTIGVYNGSVQITDPSGTRHTFPSVSAAYDVASRLHTPLAKTYEKNIRGELERLTTEGRAFGALLLEPLVLGAGGMVFVDPLFQRILVDVVRSSSDLFKTSAARGSAPDWTGLPIIFDEVFTGLHRLGPLTPASILGTSPDIAVYAKILTGGLLPLSVTLATNSIFSAFNYPGAQKVDALLHGHSYTAHPIGCAVANAAMDEMRLVTQAQDWQTAKKRCTGRLYDWKASEGKSFEGVWTMWNPEFVSAVSGDPRVEQVMSLGTLFAVTLRDPDGGYQANTAQQFLTSVQQQLSSDGSEYGLNARTLGNVAYFMSSLNSSRDTMDTIEGAVIGALGSE